MNESEKLKLCEGCRDNFYNGHNNLGVKRCWMFETATVVKRWFLHWWTAPTVPGAFKERTTLSCWHAPGQWSVNEKLPESAVDPVNEAGKTLHRRTRIEKIEEWA